MTDNAHVHCCNGIEEDTKLGRWVFKEGVVHGEDCNQGESSYYCGDCAKFIGFTHVKKLVVAHVKNQEEVAHVG